MWCFALSSLCSILIHDEPIEVQALSESESEKRGIGHALAPYRSPEERDTALRDYTARAGGVLHGIGESVEGRTILAAQFPAIEPSDVSLLVCANIHGVEFIAAEVALAAARVQSDPAHDLTKLRETANIWVIPSLNPDAYAKTWRLEGRGDLPALRKNARGVDLNRNFPRPGNASSVWFNFNGWRTGSDDEGNAFYRGVHEGSEPETQALIQLQERCGFHASANLHSTMGTVIQPCVSDGQTSRVYGQLVKAFRGGQARWKYRRVAAPWFDRFTGEQEDFQHHTGGTWSVCVEHYPVWVNPWRFISGTPLFWRFNPRDPSPWIDNDLPGIASFFRAALLRERPGRSLRAGLD